MNRLPVRILSALLLLSLLVPAYAEITSISSSINVAGRQRMLTQRMVKAYCMIGIDVKSDEAIKQLGDAVALFDRQLRDLHAFAPNDETRAALQKVDALWAPHKALLTQPVSRENAARLMRDNDDLLRATHKVVLVLEDVSGNRIGRLVNVAGRQRMLGQRLAKFYMLRAWSFDNAEIRAEMAQAENEFRGALAQLVDARENTGGIKTSLAEAQRQWDLFDHSLKRNSAELVPLIVAVTSEQLLRTMNELTGMYEVLGTAN